MLINPFRFFNGFKKQVTELGFDLNTQNQVLIAEKDDVYLQLEIFTEHYGMSKVVFAQVAVILGNYRKALADNIMNTVPNKAISSIENSSYSISSEYSDFNLDKDAVQKLEHFKALNSRFYQDENYTVFQQKGTHDPILQDPVLIQALRGKKRITHIIEELKLINLPNAWLIQKPKGLGKDSVNKAWKTVGKVVVILTIVLFIMKLLLKKL